MVMRNFFSSFSVCFFDLAEITNGSHTFSWVSVILGRKVSWIPPIHFYDLLH